MSEDGMLRLGVPTYLAPDDHSRVFAYACDYFMRKRYGIADDDVVNTSVEAREWADALFAHLGLEIVGGTEAWREHWRAHVSKRLRFKETTGRWPSDDECPEDPWPPVH